ncbi:MAG: peptidylprolyl isomerase, partial [Undibacterium sp.]|nr:peptidylprolyl isomerase [Opitutaceae bacterium]
MKPPLRPPLFLVLFILLFPISVFLRSARAAEPSRIAPLTSRLPDGLYAEFTTPRGTVTAELFYTRAALMCVNFTSLAEGTRESKNDQPFYTGLTWYRVVPGFVMQSGNPGLRDTDALPRPVTPHFPDEFTPGLHHATAGVLSMANAGPDTNSCEFFITLAPTPRLNYLHSVFGQIIRGLDLLPQIQPDDAVSIKILRIGPAAQTFRADAAAFTTLSATAKKYAAAREPGPSAHFDDPQKLIPTEPPRAKNFNYKLANLERATGIRIVARLLAKSPPDTEGRKLNNYLRDLAEQLGVLQTGALVLYVADRDEWKLWIGDNTTAAFMGRPGTVKDFMQAGAFHTAKQALLTTAQTEGLAAYAAQKSTAPADTQPPTAQRLKLITDAVLDSLIFKLEQK